MRSQFMIVRALLVTLFAAASTSSLLAQDVSTTPDLAPSNGEYLSTTPLIYNGSGLTVGLSGLELTGLSAVNAGNNLPGNTPGNTSTEQFTSFFDVFVSINGGPAIESTGTGTETVTLTRVNGTGDTGSFNTQLTALDLPGSVAGHSAVLTADTSNPSVGSTTISNASGGDFRINSFFDIFTDLSIDGGALIPQANGPTVLTLEPAPDTSSTLPLLLIPAALLTLAHRRFQSNFPSTE